MFKSSMCKAYIDCVVGCGHYLRRLSISGHDHPCYRADSTRRAAWDAQKRSAEETARVIETTVPTNGSLPISGYDEKSAGEVSARLDTLTVDQLQRLKDYERRNNNRETLIRGIERRIGAAS
jgi:hypothetical protein